MNYLQCDLSVFRSLMIIAALNDKRFVGIVLDSFDRTVDYYQAEAVIERAIRLKALPKYKAFNVEEQSDCKYSKLSAQPPFE